ncbi:MAG TPA: hypothetical protein VF316_19485 [Polyangiaceae bacterium]
MRVMQVRARGAELGEREVPRPRSGDLVAVHGLGGLGHVAVQFATKLGCKTVALSRGRDKEALLPMVEEFPLDQAGQVFGRMMSAKVHFRAVLKMGERT